MLGALVTEKIGQSGKNSDGKTTSVEQTVPRRQRERWKEKESTLMAHDGALWATGDEREMLSLHHSQAGHAHTNTYAFARGGTRKSN